MQQDPQDELIEVIARLGRLYNADETFYWPGILSSQGLTLITGENWLSLGEKDVSSRDFIQASKKFE